MREPQQACIDNDGKGWQITRRGMPYRFVWQLVSDPQRPDRIYATTFGDGDFREYRPRMQLGCDEQRIAKPERNLVGHRPR